MTTRSGDPAAGSLALKKFRVRKCNVKLRLSSDQVFSCQLEKHTPDVPHREVGYVLMPNSTARKYLMEWTDEGPAEIRQTKLKKIRTVK